MPRVDISYNQLQHGNATTTSIYDVVNEFREAVTHTEEWSSLILLPTREPSMDEKET
jgi:hypothetical protein